MFCQSETYQNLQELLKQFGHPSMAQKPIIHQLDGEHMQVFSVQQSTGGRVFPSGGEYVIKLLQFDSIQNSKLYKTIYDKHKLYYNIEQIELTDTNCLFIFGKYLKVPGIKRIDSVFVECLYDMIEYQMKNDLLTLNFTPNNVTQYGNEFCTSSILFVPGIIIPQFNDNVDEFQDYVFDKFPHSHRQRINDSKLYKFFLENRSTMNERDLFMLMCFYHYCQEDEYQDNVIKCIQQKKAKPDLSRFKMHPNQNIIFGNINIKTHKGKNYMYPDQKKVQEDGDDEKNKEEYFRCDIQRQQQTLISNIRLPPRGGSVYKEFLKQTGLNYDVEEYVREQYTDKYILINKTGPRVRYQLKIQYYKTLEDAQKYYQVLKKHMDFYNIVSISLVEEMEMLIILQEYMTPVLLPQKHFCDRMLRAKQFLDPYIPKEDEIIPEIIKLLQYQLSNDMYGGFKIKYFGEFDIKYANVRLPPVFDIKNTEINQYYQRQPDKVWKRFYVDDLDFVCGADINVNFINTDSTHWIFYYQQYLMQQFECCGRLHFYDDSSSSILKQIDEEDSYVSQHKSYYMYIAFWLYHYVNQSMGFDNFGEQYKTEEEKYLKTAVEYIKKLLMVDE